MARLVGIRLSVYQYFSLRFWRVCSKTSLWLVGRFVDSIDDTPALQRRKLGYELKQVNQILVTLSPLKTLPFTRVHPFQVQLNVFRKCCSILMYNYLLMRDTRDMRRAP